MALTIAFSLDTNL